MVILSHFCVILGSFWIKIVISGHLRASFGPFLSENYHLESFFSKLNHFWANLATFLDRKPYFFSKKKPGRRMKDWSWIQKTQESLKNNKIQFVRQKQYLRRTLLSCGNFEAHDFWGFLEFFKELKSFEHSRTSNFQDFKYFSA